jgi:hypothetical protein
MVLDPNANQGLFNVSSLSSFCYSPLFFGLILNGLQSTLAVIIEDAVTNSDAKDIVKE